MSDRQPITISIGGPDDPFNHFPSTTTKRANRHYEKTGEPLQITTLGNYVIDFIEEMCVLTDAQYAHQPFILLDWQIRYILEAFEVVWKCNKATGEDQWLRKHRWTMLGVPKKNGKTELSAALGLYLAIDDEEQSPKVVAAAASKEQADIFFEAASRMVDWSEELKPFATPRYSDIVVNTGDGAEGKITKLAAVVGSNDGKNLHGVVVDEFHEWVKPRSKDVFTVITQGGGARVQPLNMMITTAGSNEDSICFEWYERGLAVMSGDMEDDTFHFCWYEAPEHLDWRDPETWKIANPSYGLILDESFYRDLAGTETTRGKRSESEFCRYFLNRWMEADNIWEAAKHWPLCKGLVDLRSDRRTYVGIDIGRRVDNAAVVIVQWDGEKAHMREKFWINPHPPTSERAAKWSVDYDSIDNYLLQVFNDFPTPSIVDDMGYTEPGPVFFYDPHLYDRSAQILRGHGLNMIEIAQSDSNMVPASMDMFELIKKQKIVHADNPLMNKHIRSVVAKDKERGWRITRPSGSRKHVDGAVAAAMALYAMRNEFTVEEDTHGGIF